MRRTKIICTLGPAQKSYEDIRNLMAAGMDTARLNMTHGSHESHRSVIVMLRKAADELGKNIGILMDTSGLAIRTGDVSSPLAIAKGEEVLFSSSPVSGERRKVILVNYDGFAHDARGTDRILLDNGELSFDIVEIGTSTVLARAREDGSVGSRRHVNLPGANIGLPSITEKDLKDIAFAIEENVDFLALSFVRSGDDVRQVRRLLEERKSGIELVAKIETRQAVERIEEIIDAADGIMVARGDLGAELPFELIPAIQDEIVDRCRQKGKFVIVATHMLESMTAHPIPTRAEVTDVAHAAVTRADATMLSGETAAGRHPLLALEAMDRILRETEGHGNRQAQGEYVHVRNEREARTEAAVRMATGLNLPAIIVFTQSGKTAQVISSLRPTLPVIAFTNSASVQRRLQLRYGIVPLLLPLDADPETTVSNAFALVKEKSLLRSGDRIVLVSDTKVQKGLVSTVQVRAVP